MLYYDYGLCVILLIQPGSLFSLGWQCLKANEAKNDKCSHFSSNGLKRLNIPQSFKEKENGKENMFDFGQCTKQEKVFPLL